MEKSPFPMEKKHLEIKWIKIKKYCPKFLNGRTEKAIIYFKTVNKSYKWTSGVPTFYFDQISTCVFKELKFYLLDSLSKRKDLIRQCLTIEHLTYLCTKVRILKSICVEKG